MGRRQQPRGVALHDFTDAPLGRYTHLDTAEVVITSDAPVDADVDVLDLVLPGALGRYILPHDAVLQLHNQTITTAAHAKAYIDSSHAASTWDDVPDLMLYKLQPQLHDERPMEEDDEVEEEEEDDDEEEDGECDEEEEWEEACDENDDGVHSNDENEDECEEDEVVEPSACSKPPRRKR